MAADTQITTNQVLEAISTLPIRKNNNRLNATYEGQKAQSLVLGYYFNSWSKTQKLAVETTRHPEIWNLLCQFMNQHDPNFKFTAITINKNFLCKPHVDGNNTGNSYIIGLGDYEGGELNVNGTKYDIHNKFLLFDGKVIHWTEPFVGTRYTLVYYLSL